MRSKAVVACALLAVVGFAAAGPAEHGVQPCADGVCPTPITRVIAHYARKLLGVPAAPNCPRGQYLELLSGTCKQCSPGRAKNVTGAGTCLPCRVGHYASGSGNSVCSPCAPGTFIDQTARQSCYLCPRGTFAPQPGSTSCVPCFENYYAPATGTAECRACPAGTSTRGKTGAWACS